MSTRFPAPGAAPLNGWRIGVDARRRRPGGATGVAVYAQVLSETLRTLGARIEPVRDTETDRGRASRWIAAGRRAPRLLRDETGPDGRLWTGEDLFREAQVHFNVYGRLLPVRCDDPPAVMHWSYPLPLRLLGARNVYTIHDAIPLDRPELTGVDSGRHRRLLARVAEAADRIFTVSEDSREALVRRLGVPGDFVINTYQAPPQPPAASAAVGGPLPSGLVPGGYFLFWGSVEPRKNLERLVAAHRLSGASRPLVVAGPDGWRAGGLARALDAPGVLRLPWLDRPALAALICQARAALFPSLAEGFGLPAVEAMASGVPLLTSDRGALAEVAGDGALTVDPHDIVAMAAAIAALASDDALCGRLREAGRTRAATFSPAAYGRRLTSAYLGLVGQTAG